MLPKSRLDGRIVAIPQTHFAQQTRFDAASGRQQRQQTLHGRVARRAGRKPRRPFPRHQMPVLPNFLGITLRATGVSAAARQRATAKRRPSSTQ